MSPAGAVAKSCNEHVCTLLTRLETRRKRWALIEAFKILKNFENVDSNVWFKLSSTGLRGHDYKLFNFSSNLVV